LNTPGFSVWILKTRTESSRGLEDRVGVVGHLFGESDPLSVDESERVGSRQFEVGSEDPKGFRGRLMAVDGKQVRMHRVPACPAGMTPLGFGVSSS